MLRLLSIFRRYDPVPKNFHSISFSLRQTSLATYSFNLFPRLKWRTMTIYSRCLREQVQRHSESASSLSIISRTQFKSPAGSITQRFYSDDYSGAGTQLKEEDLEEQFVRGSGAGGQKINKTANCVVSYTPKS